MSISKPCTWSIFNAECKYQCLDPDPDDPQKQRVYCWEEQLHDELGVKENSFTLAQCREIIEEICLRHALNPPRVTDGRGSKVARSIITRIALPRTYREPISVVHEACHVLASYKDPEADAHGALFVRYLIQNLPTYLAGCSKAGLERSASTFGLSIASRDACKPPPWRTVQPLIKQFQTVRGFGVVAQEHAVRTKEMSRRQRDARRALNAVLKRTQRSAWPDGFHPLVEDYLGKNTP